MRKRNSVGIAGLIAGAALLLTGCSTDTAVQPVIPVSYVALYNESPDAPALEFVVDNNKVNHTPFNYSDYTSYLPFYTGSRKFRIGPFDASNVVVDTTLNLVDSKFYSIFVVDDYSKAQVLVLGDSGQTPAPGKAKIRFVNLSPDAGSVQLKNGDTAFGVPLNFKDASGFADIDAQTTSFKVVADGVNLSIPDADITAGNFYTILVKGYKTPPSGNTSVLSAEVIHN